MVRYGVTCYGMICYDVDVGQGRWTSRKLMKK
jgi:hypothetical protein